MSVLRGMVDSWGALALAVTWQLAALVVVAWLCERLFRLRQPRARHALWWFVLVAPLLLAPGRIALERREAVVRVAAPEAVLRVVSVTAPGIEQPANAPVDTGPVARESARPAASWWEGLSLTDALAAAWVLGCLSLALRLLVGHLRVRSAIADSEPVEDEGALTVLAALLAEAGIRREVALRTSAPLGAPVLYGLRRPTILLPVGWVESLSPEDLRALLAHEVAHIKRRDFLAHFLQRVVEVPLFFHPATWLASRRITLAREELADAWALRNGADALSYARALSAAAERTQTRLSVASVGVAEGRSTLLRRVEAIMRGGGLKRLSRPLMVALIGVALVSAAAFAAVQVEGTTGEEPPPGAGTPPELPAQEAAVTPGPTTLIGGVLRTSDGKPASGVTVHMEGLIDSSHPETYPTQAVTGNDGRFEMVLRAAAGKRTLWVWDERFYAIVARDIESRTGGKLALPPVILQRSGRIEGRVLDAGGGEPISGVRVICKPILESGVSPRLIRAEAKSSSNGTFVIAAPPGEALLSAIAPTGYTWSHLVKGERTYRDGSVLRVQEDPDTPAHRSLTVHPGRTLVDVELFLARALELRGRVLAPDGTLWKQGGPIYAVAQPGRVEASYRISSLGVISADGRYQIGGLMSGVPTVVFVLDEERGQGGAALVTPSAIQRQGVEVKIEPLALVRGRVLLPDGSPAVGAALEVDGLVRQVVLDGPSPPLRSGRDGTFELRQGIVGVPWRLGATLPRWTAGGPYPEYYGWSSTFTVVPGQAVVDLGDIVVRKPRRPGAGQQ